MQKRRPGRPKQSGGAPDTADRLLDAAEALFAERGFYGVTTREVSAAAGVDDALIYYHFSSKKGLFDAVFSRRAAALNEARLTSLKAYRLTADRITVHGAIAAFINPMIDLSLSGDPGWKPYFALVAQLDNTPWGGETIHRFFDDVVHELLDIIKLALPGAEMKELFWAYNFLAGSMMLALSETERVDCLSGDLCAAKDLGAVRERLIAYCAGGFDSVVALAGRLNEADAERVRSELLH